MLKLIIKNKWLDLILSGEKKEEYRYLNSYYYPRFTGRKCPIADDHLLAYNLIQFRDTIEFKNIEMVQFYEGFGKHRRSPIFEVKNIKIDTGNVNWGASPEQYYFVIELGERVK